MTTTEKKEIKLPAHLQALVNDPKVQERWNKSITEKMNKITVTITDTTPKGYEPAED